MMKWEAYNQILEIDGKQITSRYYKMKSRMIFQIVCTNLWLNFTSLLFRNVSLCLHSLNIQHHNIYNFYLEIFVCIHVWVRRKETSFREERRQLLTRKYLVIVSFTRLVSLGYIKKPADIFPRRDWILMKNLNLIYTLALVVSRRLLMVFVQSLEG